MVFFKLKDGEVKKLMLEAIKKSGSERKLAKKINASKGTIYSLKNERRNISEHYLKKILEFLNKENYGAVIERKFENNWGRKKGGANSLGKKIREGTIKKNLMKMHKSSSNAMRKWHKHMSEKEPEKYHAWRYGRFKRTDN